MRLKRRLLIITKTFIILSIILLTNSTLSYSHVKHYKNLKKIEFDIYRNSKNIGKHIFSFVQREEGLAVESELKFKIKKFGITLYNYHTQGTEIYKDNKLIKFNSVTNQNGKSKYVNLLLENNEYVIDGSSYKGKTNHKYLVGTWWNHSLVEAEAQISAVSGRIIKQKVKFLGKKTITINGKNYETLHFNFSSLDNKLAKKKRLNTDIWYEESSMNWVKAYFEKKGKWEYRLINVNY